jgi:hypothetical protein
LKRYFRLPAGAGRRPRGQPERRPRFGVVTKRANRVSPSNHKGNVISMSFGTIVLIVLILVLFGVLPTWPYASQWGYYPSFLVAFLLLVAAILVKVVGV